MAKAEEVVGKAVVMETVAVERVGVEEGVAEAEVAMGQVATEREEDLVVWAGTEVGIRQVHTT